MAKYDKETKFYWLQLKEDFFDDDAIEWLEEQENGHKYSLFYLKLCLKSLKSNGVLIRKVGNMLVPYDNKKLADLTKTPIDTVIVAMELLKGIGLVQVLESGELYITQLEKMIGSASKGALKKQQQRALQKQNQALLEDSGQKEDNCPPKIDIDIEIKNKDKDKDKEIISENKYFENDNLNSIFIEFLAVRKKLKAVNSDRAINTLINKLNKYDDAIKYEMIEKSIVNSWKDVYELKENNIKPYASNTNKRVEKVPDWFNKEQKSESMTPEEQEAFERELAELQRTLKENY